MSKDTQIPDPLLTPDDVARLLGVSVNTLNAWRVKRHHLPFVPVGRLVRYRAADVQQFIDSRVRKAGVVAERGGTMNAYAIKRGSIRRAVVDAAGKHLSPKSAADVCRALLDPHLASEDPVLRAVGLADYFLVRLRSEDAVLDLLADTLDELATQPRTRRTNCGCVPMNCGSRVWSGGYATWKQHSGGRSA